MSKVFISYASKDERIAKEIYDALSNVGADPFLASISLSPGVNWTKEVFNNLKEARWVLFIATKSSCTSPSVQQELGASMAVNKQLIPVLIDVSPNELPGWVRLHQAVDARKDAYHLRSTIEAIGKTIRDDKFWSGVVLGGLAVALLVAIGKNRY